MADKIDIINLKSICMKNSVDILENIEVVLEDKNKLDSDELVKIYNEIDIKHFLYIRNGMTLLFLMIISIVCLLLSNSDKVFQS